MFGTALALLKGTQMKTVRARIGAVAVAAGIMSIAVPVSHASAATTPVNFPYFNPATFKLPQLPALPSGGAGLSFVGPSVGGISSVIGPTVITVGAGNIFTGTTITTSGGGAVVTTGTGAP
jgi:hypothetical protein